MRGNSRTFEYYWWRNLEIVVLYWPLEQFLQILFLYWYISYCLLHERCSSKHAELLSLCFCFDGGCVFFYTQYLLHSSTKSFNEIWSVSTGFISGKRSVVVSKCKVFELSFTWSLQLKRFTELVRNATITKKIIWWTLI